MFDVVDKFITGFVHCSVELGLPFGSAPFFISTKLFMWIHKKYP